jgi:TPR repeat protein
MRGVDGRGRDRSASIAGGKGGASIVTTEESYDCECAPRVSWRPSLYGEGLWLTLGSMQKDLSVGLFEIANCFLEGVGVKKAPDVAMSYLRFAANMGDLASQEREHPSPISSGPTCRCVRARVAETRHASQSSASCCQRVPAGSRRT